ncbi:uncharacterized protein LOC132716724 [Ruditapes philippinarum]|uniref:uncharacterized protein LOC132716724 n=1 Tax=Ruditapes philippinarum TaxID=129788 RepID=UPI00295B8EE3|nr:uncharacterized protein LOC132716724 [Ruditapes philippinarum]
MLRHNNVVTLHNRVTDQPVTVGVGDGALELEPPEEGATLENPPNGGYRAWLIVLSCALINALLSSMELLIVASILKMASDAGTDGDIVSLFVALVNLYAPLGAVVMIRFGYRATVCVGAGFVMIAVIVLSYLAAGAEGGVKFFLYGPAAIGMSFIKLGALIPVLEYFTTKRMKALFLSRLGTYAGQIILIFILIRDPPDIKRRAFLRGCTGFCIGIGLLGLTLQELKLNMKDGTGTFVARTVGVGSKQILKSALFWSTCAIYFFYQWGIETPQGQIPSMAVHLKLNVAGNLSYALMPTFGELLGMFLAWIFKKVYYEEESRLHKRKLKADRMKVVFGILFVAAFCMSICCFIAPKAVTVWYFFPFSILFAALFAFCEGLRDDAVPEEFGGENVRIVEGLILMFAGLGGVITNEIGAALNDDDLHWKELFYYGGGMLLLSAFVTLTVLGLIRHKLIPSKFKSNQVCKQPNALIIIQNQANQDSQQQQAKPVQYFLGRIEPPPEQAVSKGNRHMNAQPYQQAPVNLPNQTGSFMTHQSQNRTQQTVQSDGPQNQPQSVVTIQDLQ